MPRISESDLVLPALLCIDRGNPEISTTELKACLRSLLEPRGEDLEISANRKDDRFSQKVRNLRSHKTLEDTGWVVYQRRGGNGYWRLTAAGTATLEDHRELLEGTLRGNFPYEVQQDTFRGAAQERAQQTTRRRIIVFDEDEIITEGRFSEAAVRRRARSRRLRAIALERFREETGRCPCQACGFDFQDTYGERGSDYIEIHHRKPIFTYEDEDQEQSIESALANLVPLCANCHRMVHRRRDDIWTVARLKAALES